MATEGTLTPSEYITHHLTFNTKAIGEGAFWAINIDSLVMAPSHPSPFHCQSSGNCPSCLACRRS